MSDKQKRIFKENEELWKENRADQWGGKDDPRAEAARAKAVETNKRKGTIRRKLKEDPAGFYEEVLTGYLEDNPTFMQDVMKVLAEGAKSGDSRSLNSLRDIFGLGAPKRAAVSTTDSGATKTMSKEEVDKKLAEVANLKAIKGGKS